MNKDEYKKVLIDLRNNYIDYKKNLENELINSLSSSFIKQKEYLDKSTFNLISSDSVVLSNIGKFIAYKLFRKRTEKYLFDLTIGCFGEYDKAMKEKKRIKLELNKIDNTLNFIDSVNDEQLIKYLSYKRN